MSLPTPRKIQRYGWIPDLPDRRDHLYMAPWRVLQPLPPRIDLRPGCPAVYDQGDLGSCTANAIAAAIEFDQIRQQLPENTPSRLFIYYNERAIEGTVDSDSGAEIRDGIKTVAQPGACPEAQWPYDISQFATKPPAQCYAQAGKDRAVQYQRLTPTLGQLRGCLASDFPFVFGFTVYESFESDAVAQTGNVPMPATSEAVIGGHAVMAVGYSDPHQHFLVRNSWGTGWGMEGYFTMPYAYVISPDLADDFWTIRLVL
jgi:C1A family cysteine protease